MRSAPARNALIAYFVLAFGISWSGVLVAVGVGRPELLFVAMLLGPSVASIAMTVADDGARGLRDLGRALIRWRVGARWYAALLVAPALLAVILAILSRVSPSFRPDLVAGVPVGRVLAYAAIAGLGAGIFEELGWTGFATPRLLARASWLRAGLLLGVPWAAWHALPDFVGRTAHGPLWIVHMLEWFVALAAFRVLMTWIYSHTRSLALGMAMHASFTGSQALLWPGKASLADEVVWYGVFAIALWAVIGAGLRIARRSVAASRDEATRALPGDALVSDPMYAVTHAITIAAPPDDVWPWLAQMGSGRAGWYSYDRIDNGGEPSARRVLAEHQELHAGDVMPALPGAKDVFVVASVDPPRDLVLAVPGEREPIVSWEHRVEPLDSTHCRLVARSRVARGWRGLARDARTVGARPRLIERVYRVLGRIPSSWMIAFGGLGHGVMEARHLRGIKRRAEASR